MSHSWPSFWSARCLTCPARGEEAARRQRRSCEVSDGPCVSSDGCDGFAVVGEVALCNAAASQEPFLGTSQQGWETAWVFWGCCMRRFHFPRAVCRGLGDFPDIYSLMLLFSQITSPVGCEIFLGKCFLACCWRGATRCSSVQKDRWRLPRWPWAALQQPGMGNST